MAKSFFFAAALFAVFCTPCPSKENNSKGTKPTSRYRYKTETGAYIEASRKETFSICPDKEIQGTWISEHSVSLNAENCLSVQVPNLAGTIRILFLQTSGKTDTIQVLVDQSYIQMGDYSHKVWVPDSMPGWCHNRNCEFPAYGHYENRKYNQPLIVDKTPLTMGDAQYYSKIGNMKFSPLALEEYPKDEKFEESKLPHLSNLSNSWRFVNERSKKEGLDTVYHFVDKNGYNNKDGKFIILDSSLHRVFFVKDTSVFGYRVPTQEEWLFLMRAGASTRYYWGDEEDSLIVSRYAWVSPVGLKPVAQRLPNKFGLYDMIGLTNYEAIDYNAFYFYNSVDNNFQEKSFYASGTSCSRGEARSISPECSFIRKVGAVKQYMERPFFNVTCILESDGSEECVRSDDPVLKSRDAEYEGLRLLRKTPKLHKLEKF